MSELDQVLAQLDGVRRSGRGFTARCPAHDDRAASLSIGTHSDGRSMLLHCFAGCSYRAIIDALGLTPSPRPVQTPRRHASALEEAHAEILADARRQPWADEGVRLCREISDWIRTSRRKVDELRRFAETLGSSEPEIEACHTVLARAARLETLSFAIEAELDATLLLGRALEPEIEAAWRRVVKASR